jgi:hypothetical protein
LIEPPHPTLNKERDLENLRDWCVDSRRQIPKEVALQEVISIDASQFSRGKTWELLKAIIDDERREGIKCENPRTLRTLKERLKKAGKDEYIQLAKSLK